MLDEGTKERILEELSELDAVDRLDVLLDRYSNKRAFPGGIARTISFQIRVSIGARDILNQLEFNEADVESAFALAKRRAAQVGIERRSDLIDGDFDQVKSSDDAAIGFHDNEMNVGLRVLALRFLRGAPKRTPAILDGRHDIARTVMPGDSDLAECLTIWINTVRSIDVRSWLRCPITRDR